MKHLHFPRIGNVVKMEHVLFSALVTSQKYFTYNSESNNDSHREIFEHFINEEIGLFDHVFTAPQNWDGQVDFPKDVTFACLYLQKIVGRKITLDIHPTSCEVLCVICNDCKNLKIEFLEFEKTPTMIYVAAKNSSLKFELPEILVCLVTSLQNSILEYTNVEFIGIVESCWDDQSFLRIPFVNKEIEDYAKMEGGNSKDGVITLPAFNPGPNGLPIFQFISDGIQFAKMRAKQKRLPRLSKRVPSHASDTHTQGRAS